MNSVEPIKIFLNIIWFSVKVPVLSEKMYYIYPNSSFKFELFATHPIPFLENNFLSLVKNEAWKYLTNSIVTIIDIGIKFPKIKIQFPILHIKA